ncbi:MAG TPA: L-2-hydroxyglutarate oxidase [Polyangiaceae bacterium]|nr:L-2-hydroxyglutarate oxidase [Polyangiaceae bacterium]
MATYDVVIAGAGIIGLTVARELALRGVQRLLVLDKEPRLGAHASGRNSGVLHAGLYYGTDSLKAKLCAEGSRRLQAYAAEHGIKLEKTGKVVVARSEREVPALEALYERGLKNGVVLRRLSVDELGEHEPLAHSVGFALLSPETAVIDSAAVLAQLAAELEGRGVTLSLGEALGQVDAAAGTLRTSARSLDFGHLINCAGLHADAVAHGLGVGLRYRILPFKGIYRPLRAEAAVRIRGSIYPAPDLDNPFLGVHLTRSVFGDVYAGPTAIPALGRENYRGLAGADPAELPFFARDLATMWLKNQSGMRRLVRDEVHRYRKAAFVEAVRALAPELGADDLLGSTKVGVRAQLVDEEEMRLVMDFVLESGPRSTHVLNAVSPAFTASMALAELIAGRVLAS